MHIKTQTVIPTNVKITKCAPSTGKGKSVYTLLFAEEKKLEKIAALKARANRLAAALKVGYTVKEAMRLIEEE
jgi:hypothetical protein